jgi:hypothetical protein
VGEISEVNEVEIEADSLPELAKLIYYLRWLDSPTPTNEEVATNINKILH